MNQDAAKHRRAGWPPLSYIWTAAAGIIGLIYLLRFAVQTGAAVFVVLLLGILFGLVLVYPADFLARFGWRRC